MSAAGIERRRLPLLALASILAGIASPAIGQVVLPPVVTDIVPDFAPGRDLGTLVTSNVGVHTIDGGTLAGANLFHSFASFSLAQAETARWVHTTADPASIANVINRVTGGSTSYISGTIDSTAIPNADFWFVNPAGIVFGQGALVDVPAAAHFSTAGRLRFADGESFEIATPDGSTLSMANPVAFGFLGGQGDIVFDQASFSVPAGLSLTGANLSFSNSTVGGGAVTIAAVGDDAAEVALDGSADTALSGQLALDAFSGVLSVSGGPIAINAGQLALSDNSSIVSANAASPGGGLKITADTVELDGNSHLSTYSQSLSTADGSDIRIAAGSVALRGGSYIDTLTQGAGRGGDIAIAAGSLDLSGASYLLARTTTLGTGDSGDILLNAGSLTLGGASMVRSDTTGQGKGGDITVIGSSVELGGASSLLTSSSPGAAGDSGDLHVTASSVTLSGDSQFQAGTQSAGSGGSLTVTADTVDLSDGGMILTPSFANATGDSGDLRIDATTSVSLSGASLVRSESQGSGNGGDVFVTAPQVSVAGSTFSALTFADGAGGNLTIEASDTLSASSSSFYLSSLGSGATGDLMLRGGTIDLVDSFIGAQPSTIGGAGDVRGAVGDVTVAATGLLSIVGGTITTETFGAGKAGDVSLSGADIELSALSIVTSTTNFGDSAPGDAGSVTIAGTATVTLDALDVSAAAETACFDICPSGNAGSIAVSGADITVFSSNLRSEAFGSGNAGNISFVASGALGLSDTSLRSDAFADENDDETTGVGGAAGSITLYGTAVKLTDSSITANTFGGDGGVIRLTGTTSLTLDEAFILSDTFGAGMAGAIVLAAPLITLKNFTEIGTDTFGAGLGGGITITGDRIDLDTAFITADGGSTGNAGFLRLSADSIQIADSSLTSEAFGSGNAGSVEINSIFRTTIRGSSLTSSALGGGDAGFVQVRTFGELNITGTSIATDAFAEGSGIGGQSGFIDLSGGSVSLQRSFVTSSAGGGLGGFISVAGGAVDVGGSSLLANAFGSGKGGSISLLAQTLSVADSNIDTAAFGSANAGSISLFGRSRVIVSDTVINSDTYNDGNNQGGSGLAGRINVFGADVLLEGSTVNASSLGIDGQQSGFVDIIAETSLALKGTSVSSDTFGEGDGGAVTLSNPGSAGIKLTDSKVTSSSFSTGNAGGVSIFAPTIALTDSMVKTDAPLAGIREFIEIVGDTITLDNSKISADAGQASKEDDTQGLIFLDQGFDVDGNLIPASLITLRNGSSVSTNTTGTGDGGNITIMAKRVEIEDSTIQARSVPCSGTGCKSGGPAGTIAINADVLLLSGSNANRVAAITSSTETSGIAGNIAIGGIAAQGVSLTLSGSAASISSQSSGAGDAGSITIEVDSLTIEDGAKITTTTSPTATGQGGSIFITLTNGLTMRTGGKIEADTNFVCLTESGCGDQGMGGLISVTVGGDIKLEGTFGLDGTYIRANAGRFNTDAIATASAGNVLVNAGGDISLTDGAYISSDSFGDGDSGVVAVSATNIALRDDSFISSDALGDKGSSQLAQVTASNALTLSGSSYISADVRGGGQGGDVLVKAATLDLDDQSYISSNVLIGDDPALVTGNAGDVTLDIAGSIRIRNFSYASSDARFGSGNSGTVSVRGSNITLSGDSYISSDAFGAGNSGSVIVSGAAIALADGSYISSDSLGEGDAGSAQVNAIGLLDLADNSYISSDAGGGSAGGVSVSAAALRMRGNSYISSDVLTPDNFLGTANGDGGDVKLVVTNTIDIGSGSSITASTFPGTIGMSGTVTISARDLLLAGAGKIASDSRGEGDAGTVKIDLAGTLDLSGGAAISSNAGGGNAGGVKITAASLRMRDFSAISSNVLAPVGFTGTLDGKGGDVSVAIVGTIDLGSGASITSNTLGRTTGNAGTVTVGGRDIVIRDGSSISSDSFGAGNALLVKVTAGNALTLDNLAFISSDAGAGSGGNVQVNAAQLKLDRTSYISSNVFGANSRGNAGNVAVTAGQLLLDRGSSITSDVLGFGALGRAGTVGVGVTGVLDVLGGSTISSDTARNTLGNASSVTVNAGTLNLSIAGSITSEASGAGRSGAVSVTANLLQMNQAGFISTGSINATPAGTIAVTAGNITMTGVGPAAPASQTRITSSNTGTGDAGSITIRQTATGLNSGINMSEGALITTNSLAANAGSIGIDLGAGSILRLEGRTANALIDTSAPPGSSGGAVVIGKNSAPYAVILNGGSIRALGTITNKTLLSINTSFLIKSADRLNEILIGQGEEVGLEFEDVSSGIVSTSLDVVDASRVLSGACPAARASGQYSQLTKPVIGPYAPEALEQAIPPISLSDPQGSGAGLALARSCR